MATGTSWADSSRFRAVTITSSMTSGPDSAPNAGAALTASSVAAPYGRQA